MKLKSLGSFLLAFTAVSLSFAFIPKDSQAAGFEILEQSARGIGTATAGANTGFGDGSSVYFNPAAMHNLKEATFSFGGHLIVPKSDFTNEGSSLIPSLGGSALSGSNGPNGGQNAFVGNFFYVTPINDKMRFGFGINNPFGLRTNYSREWVGRYHAVESDLKTFNLNPALSYEVAEGFVIGAGLNVLYADAQLSQAIDFGTIGVSTLGLPTAAGLGLTPQMADGFGRVQGDDWGVGFKVGAIYDVSDSTQVGVSFRSKIDITARGDADFEVPTAALPLTATGAFTGSSARAHVGLPEAISFGVNQKVSDTWAVMADATWTSWSRFDELRITFGNGQADSVTPEGWDDVWRFSLGAAGEICDYARLRFGVTYDESPVSDKAFRTPRIPDSDRFWVATGLSLDVMEDVVLDFSFAHLFVEDSDSENVNSTGAVLKGDWDADVQIVSVSATVGL